MKADSGLAGDSAEEWSGAAELYGKYYKEQNREECEIWSRLASEITGESIIPWKKARILDNEKWMIILEGIPAGGPFRVETCMKNGTASSFQEALRGDMIHQVYVGDLFVIAGQSNAAVWERSGGRRAGTGRQLIWSERNLGTGFSSAE